MLSWIIDTHTHCTYCNTCPFCSTLLSTLQAFTSGLWSLTDPLPPTADWGSEIASWLWTGPAWSEQTTRGTDDVPLLLFVTNSVLVEINDTTEWYWHWWQSELSSHSVNYTHGCQPLDSTDYFDWLVHPYSVSAELRVTGLLSFSPLLPPVCSSQRGGSDSSGRRSPTLPGSQIRPRRLRED